MSDHVSMLTNAPPPKQDRTWDRLDDLVSAIAGCYDVPTLAASVDEARRVLEVPHGHEQQVAGRIFNALGSALDNIACTTVFAELDE